MKKANTSGKKVNYAVLESLNNSVLSLPFANGEKELPREVKIRIMKLRIELDDLLESVRKYAARCIEELGKEKSGDEEKQKAFTSLMESKYRETVTLPDIVFSDAEFEDMIDVCASGSALINGNTVPRADILQLIHKYFVR